MSDRIALIIFIVSTISVVVCGIVGGITFLVTKTVGSWLTVEYISFGGVIGIMLFFPEIFQGGEGKKE